jgi:hypothetical protein
MTKRHEDRDYIEWDSDAKAPGQPAAAKTPIESLFDAEVRRRIGEVIARAAEGKKEEE